MTRVDGEVLANSTHGCSLLITRAATFDRHISFSLEGEVHVRTEDRVARHRGGHRSAGPQRVHADRDRHAIADNSAKRETCVEGAEYGAPGSGIQSVRPLADR